MAMPKSEISRILELLDGADFAWFTRYPKAVKLTFVRSNFDVGKTENSTLESGADVYLKKNSNDFIEIIDQPIGMSMLTEILEMPVENCSIEGGKLTLSIGSQTVLVFDGDCPGPVFQFTWTDGEENVEYCVYSNLAVGRSAIDS